MYDQNLRNRMAVMPPQELQKFAMMHKDDPFVVSMALNISNDRKAAQRQQAMQAVNQQQPPVVDQTLAAMGQPEVPPQAAPQMQAGLPQIPAQNIARMADGGIAGYAEGKEVKGDRESYRAYALQKAQELGLNPSFVDGIFKNESNYDPKAKSKTGPQGIGQLTSFIAKRFGISPKERLDPYKNIDASLGFMDYLNKRYKGDSAKMAVAYNQGEGVLNEHLKQNQGQLVPENLHKNVKTANKEEPFNYLKKLTAAGAIAPATVQTVEGTREAPRTPEMLARQKEAQRKREIAEAIPIGEARAGEPQTAQDKPTSLQQIAAIEQRVPVEEIMRREQKEKIAAVEAEKKKSGIERLPKTVRDVLGMPEAAASLVSGAFAPATALLPAAMSQFTDKPLTYEQAMDATTFAPRTTVGKESLGEAYRALDDFKIPPYIPGIGAPRRPSAKGPAARAAALATEAELAAAREKIAAPRLGGPAPEAAPTSKFAADVAAAARARTPKTPLMQEIEQARALEAGRKEFTVAPETAALGEEALARRRTVEQAQADLAAKARGEPVAAKPLTPVEALEADKARTAELEQKLMGDQSRASDLGFEDLRARQAAEAQRTVGARYDVGRQLAGGAAGATTRGPGEAAVETPIAYSEEPGFDFSKPGTAVKPTVEPTPTAPAVPEKKTGLAALSDEDYLMMGLNMLQAPPGQTGGMLSQLGQNIGRSGLATLGARREREKTAAEQAQKEALSGYYKGMTENLGREPESIRAQRIYLKEPKLLEAAMQLEASKDIAGQRARLLQLYEAGIQSGTIDPAVVSREQYLMQYGGPLLGGNANLFSVVGSRPQ